MAPYSPPKNSARSARVVTHFETPSSPPHVAKQLAMEWPGYDVATEGVDMARIDNALFDRHHLPSPEVKKL